MTTTKAKSRGRADKDLDYVNTRNFARSLTVLDFENLCIQIENKISRYNFKIVGKEFLSDGSGNFNIVFSDSKSSFRITEDVGYYYFEAKVDEENWELITDFIDKNYPGSTLSFDMKLHRLYQSDFSLETSVKFIGLVLLLLAYDQLAK